MWRRGYRKSSREVMFMIATKLDDQDIAALASYYQQVPASDQTTASK
jgi:cytochrome c553